MGNEEEEGDHDDTADRDPRQASSRPGGWRGRRRLRAARHDEHDGRRRAAGAHHTGSEYFCFIPRRLTARLGLSSVKTDAHVHAQRTFKGSFKLQAGRTLA
jgi:hypothetical protein